MSRALNINATQDHVEATCAKHKADISTIEVLPGGAVRVVLRNGDGAAVIRRAYGKQIVDTPLARTPLTLASNRAARPATAATFARD